MSTIWWNHLKSTNCRLAINPVLPETSPATFSMVSENKTFQIIFSPAATLCGRKKMANETASGSCSIHFASTNSGPKFLDCQRKEKSSLDPTIPHTSNRRSTLSGLGFARWHKELCRNGLSIGRTGKDTRKNNYFLPYSQLFVSCATTVPRQLVGPRHTHTCNLWSRFFFLLSELVSKFSFCPHQFEKLTFSSLQWKSFYFNNKNFCYYMAQTPRWVILGTISRGQSGSCVWMKSRPKSTANPNTHTHTNIPKNAASFVGFYFSIKR